MVMIFALSRVLIIFFGTDKWNQPGVNHQSGCTFAAGYRTVRATCFGSWHWSGNTAFAESIARARSAQPDWWGCWAGRRPRCTVSVQLEPWIRWWGRLGSWRYVTDRRRPPFCSSPPPSRPLAPPVGPCYRLSKDRWRRTQT